MNNITQKPQTIEEYIAVANDNVKEHLVKMYEVISSIMPTEALPCISYEMPAYKLNGVVVYFAGFTKHVSLFPGPKAIAFFNEELTDYKTSKGTIQFPVNKKLPVLLIKKIVKYNIKENLAKNKKK